MSAARTRRLPRVSHAVMIVLTVIVALLGLWSAAHSDEAPAAATAAQIAQDAGAGVVAASAAAALADGAGAGAGAQMAAGAHPGEMPVLQLLSCVLGVLCGIVLTVMLTVALRSRPVWSQRREHRGVIRSLYDSRRLRVLALPELSILRI